MRIVHTDDVRAWIARSGDFRDLVRSIGQKRVDDSYIERTLGVPEHMLFVIQRLSAEAGGHEVPATTLDSIPFYSLCRGLFLPISGLSPERAVQLFGLKTDPSPDATAREALVQRFLDSEVGLPIEQKLGCILGDPFQGRRSTFRRDSLMRLLASVQMVSWRALLDDLARVGDVSVLFAAGRRSLRVEPQLTSREVLEAMRFFPDEKRNRKFDILRSILLRCGKLEAYFLAKLMLRKAGFGFDYQGPLVSRALSSKYGADNEAVAHAIALTDVFHVARVLAKEGPGGLKAIRLQPLVPVRPALASASSEEGSSFPVWVERKYDGVRLMLHKSTDARGSMLCGAYTRSRGDWLELVPGLDATIRALPARSVILDGELHGTVMDIEGVRPASVYEVYAYIQGDRASPVNVRYAAFDILYVNGQDLTGFPLSERRRYIAALFAPITGMPLPIPLSMSEGQLAGSREDVNRLFHHFRAQGYEGIITKDFSGTYRLAERDPKWLKRKPEITLDLVLLGGMLAVTSKENVGAFGSYIIGARRPDGSFEDVGDVAGVDRLRDLELQSEIMREGLLSGRRIERKSISGMRPGFEFLPHIVATVKFEGIVRDMETKRLSLRDPKIAIIRADKGPHEADSTQALEEIYLRQRVG